MRLNELVEDGDHVFCLQGEIDLHYSPVLRSLCQSKIKARCPVLILDLSGVDYIDSTGLAVSWNTSATLRNTEVFFA